MPVMVPVIVQAPRWPREAGIDIPIGAIHVIVADLPDVDIGVIPNIGVISNTRAVAADNRPIDVAVTPVRTVIDAGQRALIVSKARPVSRTVSNARQSRRAITANAWTVRIAR